MVALSSRTVSHWLLLLDFNDHEVAQGMALKEAVVSGAVVRTQPMVLNGLVAMTGAAFIVDAADSAACPAACCLAACCPLSSLWWSFRSYITQWTGVALNPSESHHGRRPTDPHLCRQHYSIFADSTTAALRAALSAEVYQHLPSGLAAAHGKLARALRRLKHKRANSAVVRQRSSSEND